MAVPFPLGLGFGKIELPSAESRNMQALAKALTFPNLKASRPPLLQLRNLSGGKEEAVMVLRD